MFIPDPGSWFLPIPDLGSPIQKQQQKRGVKKKIFYTFLCSHKFHKIENYISFEVLKKKIWDSFQRIIKLFAQKIVTKLSKIWVWDPGSAIRKKPIPDPGSRGQKGTGSRIRIRNTDRRPRICQKYLIVFGDGAISLKTHTEIRAILQWFYLNEVVSKYAKSILAYTENKLKEYKRIRRKVRTPRVFVVYREYVDRHKTEDISTNFWPKPKQFQILNHLSRRDRMSK
jgi:hypothetical protein